MSPAIVDIKTKKISGCSNEHEYNHEKAHLDFANSNFGANIQYTDEMIWRADIIFIVLTLIGIPVFKWFALAGIFINLGLFIFEEMWCNWKANKSLNT